MVCLLQDLQHAGIRVYAEQPHHPRGRSPTRCSRRRPRHLRRNGYRDISSTAVREQGSPSQPAICGAGAGIAVVFGNGTSPPRRASLLRPAPLLHAFPGDQLLRPLGVGAPSSPRRAATATEPVHHSVASSRSAKFPFRCRCFPGRSQGADVARRAASARRPLPPGAGGRAGGALFPGGTRRAEAWHGPHWYNKCSKLAHPTCAVYHYNNETGLINRRRPDPSMNRKCDHPLCDPSLYARVARQAQQNGRGDDPLMIYCVVRDLIYPLTIIPWLNEYETHLPIADPAAAAASGDRVCYVELEHMSYREGYYIRCPNPYKDGRHSICTVFTDDLKEEEEVIAAAVWEYRRLHYRNDVWPRYGTPESKGKHDDVAKNKEKHDEL